MTEVCIQGFIRLLHIIPASSHSSFLPNTSPTYLYLFLPFHYLYSELWIRFIIQSMHESIKTNNIVLWSGSSAFTLRFQWTLLTLNNSNWSRSFISFVSAMFRYPAPTNVVLIAWMPPIFKCFHLMVGEQIEAWYVYNFLINQCRGLTTHFFFNSWESILTQNEKFRGKKLRLRRRLVAWCIPVTS